MPALHDYECEECGAWTEHVTPMDSRPATQRCACGGRAEWRPCAPAVHTLASFSADIDDAVVRKTRDPGDGSYMDPNLGRDENGRYHVVKSRKHREQLMAAKGLSEFGETDESRDVAKLKRTRPFHVNAGGPKGRRAHG